MSINKLYVIHHRYSDGSGSRVVPVIITEHQKCLIEMVLDSVGTMQDVEFVEVQMQVNDNEPIIRLSNGD